MGEDIFTMQPSYENLTNPLIAGNSSNGQVDLMRAPDASLSDNNENNLNCYFDQHSGIASNNIVNSFKSTCRQTQGHNSPGTIQTQSQQNILRFNPCSSVLDFNMSL